MSLQPVFQQILAHADGAADKAAIISGDQVLTYGELGTRVTRSAAVLENRFKVKPGDRVILLTDSSSDFIATYLAVHSLGGVCAPFSSDIADDRLSRVVQRLSPRIVVSETLRAGVQNHVRYSELTDIHTTSASTGVPGVSIDQTADILFTTGTTARSKGVVLSHRAVATASAHINAFIGTRADDVEVLSLLLGHSFGLGRMRCVLSIGATLVLAPGIVNAAKITNALLVHRATGFASVPAGIAILLSDEGSSLSQFAGQLKYIEIGSSTMPLERKLRLMRLLPNTRICMHYGLTEASRSAYISFHDEKTKLDSIGRPSPGVEMRIVDRSGDAADVGAEGHIEVRGDHLMTEYWQDPQLTAETLRDGWLRTGDLGLATADGYYYLKARSSDVINVGGRKVMPQEIEEILATHPAIAECACVGIPDPQGLSGEIVSAYLVARLPDAPLPGFPELAKLLRQKLEPYKTPRQFRWVAEIPKSASGKVLRRQLRDLK
ncbi:MAG: class I adenylate-forming enzyme family protein [Woeseia sp.]